MLQESMEMCVTSELRTNERKWMENCQQVIDLVARYRIRWTRPDTHHTHSRKSEENNNGGAPKKKIPVAKIDEQTMTNFTLCEWCQRAQVFYWRFANCTRFRSRNFVSTPFFALFKSRIRTTQQKSWRKIDVIMLFIQSIGATLFTIQFL